MVHEICSVDRKKKKERKKELEPCVVETTRTLPAFGVSQVTQG